MSIYRKPQSARAWGYWLAIAIALVILVARLTGHPIPAGNAIVLVIVVIALFLRPGGFRGRYRS
jgi:hypothetical protein